MRGGEHRGPVDIRRGQYQRPGQTLPGPGHMRPDKSGGLGAHQADVVPEEVGAQGAGDPRPRNLLDGPRRSGPASWAGRHHDERPLQLTLVATAEASTSNQPGSTLLGNRSISPKVCSRCPGIQLFLPGQRLTRGAKPAAEAR